jgi:hypothetical protein
LAPVYVRERQRERDRETERETERERQSETYVKELLMFAMSM